MQPPITDEHLHLRAEADGLKADAIASFSPPFCNLNINDDCPNTLLDLWKRAHAMFPLGAMAELMDNSRAAAKISPNEFIDTVQISPHRIINTVKMRIEKESGGRAISFTDNGRGMNRESLYLMMKPVERTKGVINTRQGFKKGTMSLGGEALVLTNDGENCGLAFLSRSANKLDDGVIGDLRIPFAFWHSDGQPATVLNPLRDRRHQSDQPKGRYHDIQNDESVEKEVLSYIYKSKGTAVASFEALRDEFRKVAKGGTRIIVWMLHHAWIFDEELSDIMIPSNKCVSFIRQDRHGRNFPPGIDIPPDYSLLSYCQILFFKSWVNPTHEPRYEIFIMGRKVRFKNLVSKLYVSHKKVFTLTFQDKNVSHKMINVDLVVPYSPGDDHECLAGCHVYWNNNTSDTWRDLELAPRLVQPYVCLGIRERQGFFMGMVSQLVLTPQVLDLHNSKQIFETDSSLENWQALEEQLNQAYSEYYHILKRAQDGSVIRVLTERGLVMGGSCWAKDQDKWFAARLMNRFDHTYLMPQARRILKLEERALCGNHRLCLVVWFGENLLGMVAAVDLMPWSSTCPEPTLCGSTLAVITQAQQHHDYMLGAVYQTWVVCAECSKVRKLRTSDRPSQEQSWACRQGFVGIGGRKEVNCEVPEQSKDRAAFRRIGETVAGNSFEITLEVDLPVLDGSIRAAAQLVKKCGGRTLQFSKVSVVGQGWAGKSALIRSMLGQDFEKLERTAGVKADMCEVAQYHIEGKSEEWALYRPRSVGLVAQIQARMVAEIMEAGDEVRFDNSQKSMVQVLRKRARMSKGIETNQECSDIDADVEQANFPAHSTDKKQRTTGDKEEKSFSSSPQGHAEAAEIQPVVSLVQQFLHTKGGTQETMKLLLEDFGGQDCFYELYSILFSEHAVYVLVFNMEWFLHDSEAMTEGLKYLRHWLLTVQVYCQAGRASIILVGTHKDKVQACTEHQKISNLLLKQLHEHPAWKLVVQITELSTESGSLCFFPVDNTMGKSDAVLGTLMRQIEATVRQSEHLKYKIPFAWFSILDQIEELKQKRTRLVTHAEFLDICRNSGLPSSPSLDLKKETGLVLDFLTELGLLLYHAAMPRLIVIRPSEFLFPYFTKIICDFKIHPIWEHNLARCQHKREFAALERRGILSSRLFEVLWKGLDHQNDVRELMIGLGLIVPISGKEIEMEREYLVPSILPLHPNPVFPKGTIISACAVFAVSDSVASWERDSFIDMEEVKVETQVPDGLFSRLIGSLASLCQQISPYPSIHKMKVSKNFCLFHLGSSSFTLINHKECMGIHVVKGSGHEITQLLDCQIRAILVKFIPGFDFRLFVPSNGGQGLIEYPYSEDLRALTVLTGKYGIKARVERGEGMIVNTYDNLTFEELQGRFGDWIIQARGGALSDDQKVIIEKTATTGKPVSTGCASGDEVMRIAEISCLQTGNPVETVLGLEVLMNISCCQEKYNHCMKHHEKGIQEEITTLEDDKVSKALSYILNGEAGDKNLDKGRQYANLDYFCQHESARKAMLTTPEVLALRLYTTIAYKSIDDPLRDRDRQANGRPCPLPVTTRFAYDATKKLRALNVNACKGTVLWRGMRDLKVTDDFLAHGGTEQGFMSATKKLEVAVCYSLSRDGGDQAILLFKILVPTFISSGAELDWISAFPNEDEVLFPPLTFLQPTGRVDRFDVQRNGRQVNITVVEVVPHLA